MFFFLFVLLNKDFQLIDQHQPRFDPDFIELEAVTLVVWERTS